MIWKRSNLIWSCCQAVQHGLRLTAQALMGTVWLVASAAVLAQAAAPDQGNTNPLLIQRQGQQKQRLLQGQATTQLSRSQAKGLEQAAPPAVAPAASAASTPHLVTQAEVVLQQQQRLQRLNTSKVDPAAAH